MYNFSPRANDLLAKTQLYAGKYDHGQITTLHVLMATICTEDSLAHELLVMQGVNIKTLTDRLHYHLDNQVIRAKDTDIKIPMSDER